LPNYDGRRPLESYLFSICAYKLTDHLRREGRRPALRLPDSDNSSGGAELPGSQRQASSLARSAERQTLEAQAVAQALASQIARWRQQGEWTKLKCAELLFVRGWGNKQVAQALGLSEQQVANAKFEFLSRMRTLVARQQVSADVFPELYQSDERP
jgi:RNA polymerase sigma-70 factor (ECF subfamily)